MNFCLSVLSHLVAATAEGETTTEDLWKVEEALAAVLMMAHVTHHSAGGEEESHYNDSMAALLSVYIDSCLQISSRGDKPTNKM